MRFGEYLLQNRDHDWVDNYIDYDNYRKWLKNYSGAIVLVSHDRQFLDSITNRTIELSFSKINGFS